SDRREEVDHLPILRGRSVPRVDELHNADELFGAREIPLDQGLPATSLLLRHLRVAVSGEVDQIEAQLPSVRSRHDFVEIDLLRLSGRRRNPRDELPGSAEKAVDEAGFADVGPAREGDLRQTARWRSVRLRNGPREAHRLDDHLGSWGRKEGRA